MKVVIITGSGGLIGSEAVRFFSDKFDSVIGIDNNYREVLFGKEASVEWNIKRLKEQVPNYEHCSTDIRNFEDLSNLFRERGKDIALIIHAAAQPSHDWAAKEPFTDFGINAGGTLNMLELTRTYCPEATFIFTSTNKVYGDNPNFLPLVELDKRWEISENHPYYKNGIDELLSIDQTKHSLFGASKLSADIMVQEYGRYFNMKTGVFRGGCLTGPNHSGTQLHGFLSYLVKCAVTGEHYTVFGYKGKQVRDNIHSWDLVNMFWHFYQRPRSAEVYNAGGGRHSNCSILEAIDLCQSITGKKMNYSIIDNNRSGDHIWWISDISKFKNQYPSWNWKYDLNDIIVQIHNSFLTRV
jgi:CDP-paratose 2-epimerase